MSTLKEAIAAFQAEIAAAIPVGELSSGKSPAGGWPWSADRVTLDLAVTLVDSQSAGHGASVGPSLKVVVEHSGASEKGGAVRAALTDGGSRGTHRLTIEFSLRGAFPSGTVSPDQTAALAPSEPGAVPSPIGSVETVSREDSTRLLLTELLGPPGFYSSARAAVLGDALRGQTSEQARAVAVALNRRAQEIEHESVRQARHLIRGIVQTGPLKSTERAEQLLLKLIEWWPIPDLLQFIATHWRPEDHW